MTSANLRKGSYRRKQELSITPARFAILDPILRRNRPIRAYQLIPIRVGYNDYHATVPGAPDLANHSSHYILGKHPGEISVNRRSGLRFIFETFVQNPYRKSLLQTGEPTRFENVEAVVLKFALEQGGDSIFAS